MNRKKSWKWTLIASVPVFIIILPVYFVLIGGFQTVSEIFHKPPYWFPPNPTFEYYKEALIILLPYLKNSLIISLGTLGITLALSSLSAFALAKFKFFFQKSSFFLVAFVQMLPATAFIIPLFLIFNNLRLINTYLSAMLGISVFTVPFATIVLIAYMRAIPTNLLEVALIDGAGLFRMFRSIVLPLSKPSIATVGILTFIMAWGDFIVSLSFLKEGSLQTMSIGLYRFIGRYGVQWNMLMAGSIIFSIPPLILALIAGKSIVSGLTAGALKG